MDIQLLKEVLEVPTVSGAEDRMVEFLIDWAGKNSIPVILDTFGNVYLKKGSVADGDYFPCVMAHMDTVQRHEKLVEQNLKLILTEKIENGKTIIAALNPLYTGDKAVTGVGGDDKAGIAICLDIISKTDNIIGAFFKSEEIGCLGAKNAEPEIFNSIGYAIEFDAPGNDWLSYVSCNTQLFDKSFFKLIDPILLRYGIGNIRDCDPFTDIFVIKRMFDINCLNFFAGYYRFHSIHEYVIYEDTEKSANMAKEIIDLLGNKRHELKYNRKIELIESVIFDTK